MLRTRHRWALPAGLAALLAAAVVVLRAEETPSGDGGASATVEAAAVDASPAQLKMYEAMLDVQDKRYTNAIPKLEWVIAEDPTLLGAWETLGWAYWLSGREKDAAALWQRLVEIAPNEPLGYNLLAQAATRDGDLDRAAALYEQSLRLNPEQYETRLARARVMLWGGQSAPAVEALRQLLREDPARMDVEIDLAWALYADEQYESVVEVWNHINEVAPDQPDYLVARANALLLVGALQEAEADALHVLELDPNHRGAVNLLAGMAIRARRPREAVAALEKVMQLTESDLEKGRVAVNIAAYMKSVYDRDRTVFTMAECLSAARRAYEIDPGNVSIRLFYGELLLSAREYSRAEEIFEGILKEMNPFNLRAQIGLLETYFGRMLLDQAEAKLSEIFRTFNSHNPFRHIYWARLHFARGDYLAALDALERLEREGAQGAVFTLLYHGLSPSEWSDMPSVRQFREQLMTLRRAGFKFITPSQFTNYFAAHHAPAPEDADPPWLYRVLEHLRYAWTGRKPSATPALSDYVPDRVVCVTFDDALRNALRHGTAVADEVDVPLTVFVPVGNILSRDMHVASFPELRAYLEGGRWEAQSHLWDAGNTMITNREGRAINALPNLLWLPEKQRRESLREYHARLRREFRESRRVLLRELKLPEDALTAVAYPQGDIGQETACNIDVFNVPEIIVNEAEISYRCGFLQDNFGYAVATDDPMLYKRYEVPRTASGRDLLREAFKQHPVFQARRMRAEIAALNGQLHLALKMLETLKRDGYPEEDLAELTAYVKQHLARLVPLPDTLAPDMEVKKESWLQARHPSLAIEAEATKANVMIDAWRAQAVAGVNLNPRLILQGRAGVGGIKQTVRSNLWVDVEQTSISSSRSEARIVTDGEETYQEEWRTTYTTVMVKSNLVTEHKFKADETSGGVGLRYIHENGALTALDGGYRAFRGKNIPDDEDGAIVGAVEHQWRPVMALDIAARYQHDLVPSARELIAYDGLALRGFWRIRDWWHASGRASFARYDDDNSHVHADLENLWRLSQRYEIWFGLHDSLDTVDRDSDLYWTPYWDQRHYFVLRLGRSYPNYFAMVRLHLGLQKEEGRPEEMERYYAAKKRGEVEGWYPGENPDQSWASLLGIGASLTRRWANGWEFTSDFSVNAIRDYTEHTLSGSLGYRF